MQNYKQRTVETAEFLRSRISALPQIGLMTGTGLGESAEFLHISESFDYKDIPNFPTSTVESHPGRL
ncbi:MAG: purine-nucleoside phosphorylase, partial [Desulfobacterales bacterium]